MAGPIKISFLADVGKAQKDISSLGDETKQAGKEVETSGGGIGKSLDAVGKSAVGMNAAVDTVTSGLSALDQIQNRSRNEANRLARAQADVEQAEIDGKQAAIDLRQATEDLRQAQIDGRQAAVDIGQAQIDSKQAALDTATAQKAYTDAVKQHGKNSAEARQAEIDLEQAKNDQKQATVDLTQAQADARQSQVDATQATSDGKQAQVDAKTSALDLAEAQRQVNPTPIQQAMHAAEMYAPVLAAVAVAGQTMTGVQWALNVAMEANPIGLVVVAIGLLVAGFVLAYNKSETFRNAVNAVGRAFVAAGSAVKDFTVNAFRWITNLNDKIMGVFSGIGSWLRDAGRRLIGGFLDGILGQFDAVKSTLGNLTSKLTSWKGPPARDRALLRGSGRLVMGGFLDGLQSQYGAVQRSLGGFTDGITADATATVQATAAGSIDVAGHRELTATLTVRRSGDSLVDALMDALADRISVRFGGSVQTALGR